MNSAYGKVLFFVASRKSLASSGVPYPPFDLPTISSLALAYYVLFAELYSEITSLPADLKIRQNIRRVAKDDTTLLRSIATAEKEKEVESVEMIATRKQQRN